MPSFRGMRQTVRGGSGGYEAMYGAPTTDSSGRKVVSIGGDSSPSAPALSGKEQRRKDKALKKINETPLKPSQKNNPFAQTSDAGFEMSDAASNYATAKRSESRLGFHKSAPHLGYDSSSTQTPSFKERDQDTVSAYVATGKSPYSPEGEAHLAPKKAARKQLEKDYG
jgi:hypothetical protein